MMVDWSYEVVIATVAVLLVFVVSSFWTRDIKKVLFLLIGFSGLWLAIVQPFYEKEKAFETTKVDDIQGFLISDRMAWTDTVQLAGADHKLADIDLLKGYTIEQVDFIVPSGFVDISIPEVIEGESFSIRGRVETVNDSLTEIWLESPSGEKNQATFEDQGNFIVDLIAPVKGLYEYQIRGVRISGDSLQEIVPLQVEASSKMSMLIMAGNPQFELNYLKNYWVALGHSMVQKVKISKDKYSTSFVNIPKFSFSTLSSNVLDQFDILLMDIATWNSISSSERISVLKAVREKGLGLALKPMKADASAKGLPYHKVSRFVKSAVEDVAIEFAEIEKNSAWKSEAYGSTWKNGFGTIMLVDIGNSYQLILHDKVQKYNLIWAEMLSELFVKKNEGFTINTPFLSFEDEMITSQIGFSNQGDKLILNDSIAVVVNYTPFLDGDGEALISGHQGWNKVSKEGTEEVQWFYVFEKGSWESMRRNQIKNYIDWMRMNRGEAVLESHTEHHEIPWWISILVMILGFGVVWFWEKLG